MRIQSSSKYDELDDLQKTAIDKMYGNRRFCLNDDQCEDTEPPMNYDAIIIASVIFAVICMLGCCLFCYCRIKGSNSEQTNQ